MLQVLCPVLLRSRALNLCELSPFSVCFCCQLPEPESTFEDGLRVVNPLCSCPENRGAQDLHTHPTSPLRWFFPSESQVQKQDRPEPWPLEEPGQSSQPCDLGLKSHPRLASILPSLASPSCIPVCLYYEYLLNNSPAHQSFSQIGFR